MARSRSQTPTRDAPLARGRMLVLGAAVLVACGQDPTSQAQPDASLPVLLGTTEVIREERCEPILGTGTLVADKTTDIGPRVDGIIDEIYVEVGDRVAAGQPLFRTRPVDYRIRQEQAQANLQLARAEARQAERDLDRVRALRGKRVVSLEQLEAAQTRREISLARVEAARAALERARQDLADTTVTAPYDGVITRRGLDEGAMMRTVAAASSSVVQIMKTDVLVAVVHVPELHLPRIALGTPGRVRIDGVDREIETAVSVLNDSVDPATHTVEVRLPVANPDLVVKPGLFVTAQLEPAARALDVLDRRAVLGFGDERYVFLAEDGRAVRRAVRVRDLDVLRVEVLAGLEPGERALVGPDLSRLTDGTPVRVRATASETSRVAL